jgi:serine/threonine-protein kinase
MNEQPEPLTALRSGVPMKLEEIVNKLLSKDPDERYQNIIELPVDLKNIILNETATSKIESSSFTDTVSQKNEMNVRVKYSYKTILIGAIILTGILSAILGSILTWILKPGPPPPKPGRMNNIVISLRENTSLFFSTFNRMAISPDGNDIVYLTRVGGSSLFMKKATAFEPIVLEGTRQGRAPFFSPDGRWIGFLNRQSGEIYKMLVEGGSPLKVASFQSSNDYHSATWAPDNTIIYTEQNVLKRIADSGGEPTVLTKLKNQNEEHLFPHMLPDGKTVLFTVAAQAGELNSYRLALFSFGDEDYRIILDEEGYNGVYSSSGHIIFGRSNRLMGVAFDLKSLSVSGGVSTPILNDVQTGITGSMSYALSKEGTITYVPNITAEGELRSVLNVDLSGNPTDFFDLKKHFSYARYSPDGKYVGFILQEENVENIWIYQIEGGAINQLTFYKQDGVRFFAWSPDSKNIAYGTKAEDATNSIYVRRIDGTGTAHKVYTSPASEHIYVTDWSRDGDKLLFDQQISPTGFDIFVYSFQDSIFKPLITTPELDVDPSFSPNGKWLLFISRESGKNEIYVRPFPAITEGVWKISDNGGVDPVWSPDGNKIYYRNENEMYSVEVTTTDKFSKGNPKKIFEGNYFLPRGRRWDIHPSGERFIMIQAPELGPQEQKIFVIQNFSEELNRLVPVDKN